MFFYSIQPAKVDQLASQLAKEDWLLIHQEAGQTHFIGWGYIKRWRKSFPLGEAECTLHYSDLQGQATAHCELNRLGNETLAEFLTTLAL